MVRETGVQSRVESYQRLKKMVHGTSLLSTQHYKVWIKGKVKQSRERSSALPPQLSVVAIEKGAFGSPSTMVANFTYYLYQSRRQPTGQGLLLSQPENSYFRDVSSICIRRPTHLSWILFRNISTPEMSFLRIMLFLVLSLHFITNSWHKQFLWDKTHICTPLVTQERL